MHLRASTLKYNYFAQTGKSMQAVSDTEKYCLAGHSGMTTHIFLLGWKYWSSLQVMHACSASLKWVPEAQLMQVFVEETK